MGLTNFVNKLIGNTPEARAEKERKAQLIKKEAKNKELFLNFVDKQGLPNPIVEELNTKLKQHAENHTILRPNEKVLIFSVTDLYEERSVRKSSGSAISFRLMKGVYYHTGGASSFSTPQMTCIDNGALIVTTERLIFSGNKRSFEIPLTRIINVAHGDNQIMISASGNYKNKVFELRKSVIYTLTFYLDDEPFKYNVKDEPILLDAIITGAVRCARDETLPVDDILVELFNKDS